jgi:hypothetical protein
MSDDNEQKEALEAFYKNLSPEARRDRILLQPAFRDDYNEITQAHRVVQVPHYFWTKWVPTLGPVATALYMQLRQYCYYNPTTGERRDRCWPKQTTLAREIGVKDQKTIRKGLRLLEEHGFIRRERTYYKDPVTGRPHQGTDKYLIYFEIPLTTIDAVGLLLRQTSHRPDEVSSYDGKKSRHRASPVDNTPYDGKKSPHIAREKIPRRTSTRTNTYNVNVKSQKLDQEPDLERQALQESLAQRIAEELDDHASLGFFRLVAGKCPEEMIWRALSETKDAYLTGRIKKSRGACFTDLIKRGARERGIMLSIAGEEP